MSKEITGYVENAQITMAAYAENLSTDMDPQSYVEAMIDAGFSQIQAENFVNTYEIVDQHTDSVSGFSGTIFKHRETGAYTLAIRGTERGNFEDVILADALGIALDGQAQNQINAMNAWFGSLITPQAFGGQERLDQDIKIDVTGHSLGGHLATVFTMFWRNHVAHAYTYNGAGTGDGDRGALMVQLREILGFESDEPIPDALISNFFAEPGLEIAAGLGVVFGESIPVFIEDQGFVGEDLFFGNHGILHLTDALAVYDLLSQIDPAKSAGQILHLGTDILEAASNEAEASLETIVNGLGKVFRAGEKVEVGDRDALYRSISTIRDQVTDQAPLQLVSLVNLSVDDIWTRAAADSEEGFAYRHALQNLLPFAVLGDASLYDQEGLAAAHFSQAYLADRAEALDIILQGNLRDRAAVRREGRRPIGTDFIEYDADGSAQPLARIAGRSQGGLKTQRVLFGSSEADTLYGGSEADRLYGGAGDDTLYGSAPGVDDGHRDRLEGGAGEDTYHAGRGDVILDTDRQGTINLNSISLAGDYRLESEAGSGVLLYRHTARTIRLTLADDRAVFTRRDGSVTVEAFTTDAQPFVDGDFGISLIDKEVPDDDGLNIVDGTEGNDELAGTADDDLIRGLDGDDDLYGRQGRDILEGGADNDYLNSSAFLDGVTLFPDDPGDWLFGGDDVLSGGSGELARCYTPGSNQMQMRT